MRASSGHQSAGELEGAVSPEQKSLRQLEAYFLQTVLSEIMPQQKSGLLGDGYADDMWRQMSCEHMANQLAKRDVLGFEKTMLARVDEDFHNAREHGSKD